MNAPEPTPNSSDLPSLEQNVTGDRNQVIGQILGGIVINQLTINDRVPATAVPPPIPITQPLTQQEYRQRQVLLSKVKKAWIKGVLEASLHTRALIELGLQERLDLVQHPFNDIAEFSEVSGQALAEGTSATTVFDQMEAGRTLLILGEPGSGKTITLLKLAEALITRSEKDLSQPIPVVFNLSSWAKRSQTIEQWLVQELLEKYQVSKALGKKWVETESLILLLDGLDEVKAEYRNACVQALNQFVQIHGITELTICCRIKDYQVLTDQLVLRSAICIQPLTSDQIEHYLNQAGEQLSALKTVLYQDKELQGLATSPLMLSIMSLAYQGCATEELSRGGTHDEYHQRLFDTYIERMFHRRGTTRQYSRSQTQSWLIWLAQHMTVSAQTVFLIEQLQPSWLQNVRQKAFHWVTSFLLGGLSCGLIYTLIGNVILGYGLNYFLEHHSVRVIAVISGIYGTIIGWGRTDIKTVGILSWSWQRAKEGIIKGLIIGLIGGPILGLIGNLLLMEQPYELDELIDGVSLGLLSGLAIGLICGLLIGTNGQDLKKQNSPNQGIKESAIRAAFITIMVWLSTTIIWIGLDKEALLGDALRDGLAIGLIVGLVSGGKSCIKHLTLRLMLSFLRYSPWNYARFLDHATDRLFLQKVGGGYIFVHRMLMEHFAEMKLKQGKH